MLFLKDVLSPFLTFTWSIPQLGYNMAVLHPLSLWCCCTPSSVCLIVFAAVAASAPRKSLGASSANASSSCSSQCSTPGQSLHNITGYTQIMVWWRWCWGCFYIHHSQQRANMLVVTQCVLAPRRPGRKASETSSVVPRGSLRRRTRGPWRWRTMKRPEAAGCRRPAGSMSCYIVVQVVRCNADPPTHRRVVFAKSWLFSQLIDYSFEFWKGRKWSSKKVFIQQTVWCIVNIKQKTSTKWVCSQLLTEQSEHAVGTLSSLVLCNICVIVSDADWSPVTLTAGVWKEKWTSVSLLVRIAFLK